jgi:hypothetical protein
MNGRVIAQAVSHRPLTAEAGVRARVSPRGYAVDKVTVRQVYLPSSSLLLCQYHSTMAFHTRITSGG